MRVIIAACVVGLAAVSARAQCENKNEGLAALARLRNGASRPEGEGTKLVELAYCRFTQRDELLAWETLAAARRLTGGNLDEAARAVEATLASNAFRVEAAERAEESAAYPGPEPYPLPPDVAALLESLPTVPEPSEPPMSRAEQVRWNDYVRKSWPDVYSKYDLARPAPRDYPVSRTKVALPPSRATLPEYLGAREDFVRRDSDMHLSQARMLRLLGLDYPASWHYEAAGMRTPSSYDATIYLLSAVLLVPSGTENRRVQSMADLYAVKSRETQRAGVIPPEMMEEPYPWDEPED